MEHPVLKTFGTFLKDKPDVAAKALMFRAIRPSRRIKLPVAFPSNSQESPEWIRYKNLISSIKNQGSCGSCWAFATSGVLEDRYSLLSMGKVHPRLSAGKLTMCTFKLTKFDQKEWDKGGEERKKYIQNFPLPACDGNDLYSACQELYSFGTMTEECVPYKYNDGDGGQIDYNVGISSDRKDLKHCWDIIGVDFDTCANGKDAARIYRADDIYSLEDREGDIMQEIYRWGPVAAGFKVYDSFINSYDGKTIYEGPKKDKSGNVLESAVGGHAVRIVGWGEEDGVPYWWIANSWSDKWGINGYFRMKRSIPECMLEENVVSMKPSFPGESSVWEATLDLVQPIDKKLREIPGNRVDKNLFYRESAVEKIKNGKLEGELDSIIDKKALPNGGNYKNFFMGDYITGVDRGKTSKKGGKGDDKDEMESRDENDASNEIEIEKGWSISSIVLFLFFLIFLFVGVYIYRNRNTLKFTSSIWGLRG